LAALSPLCAALSAQVGKYTTEAVLTAAAPRLGEVLTADGHDEKRQEKGRWSGATICRSQTPAVRAFFGLSAMRHGGR